MENEINMEPQKKRQGMTNTIENKHTCSKIFIKKVQIRVITRNIRAYANSLNNPV